MGKNTFATVIPPFSAFGEWRTAGEDIWNEATVAPWRGLFENLDDLATDLPESETPLSLADEALAIFAACWRYGSYAHVLTHGAPLPEAIRRDPEAGRITDWEMRRIQIEFSAALAAWWELEDTEPGKARRRARAARELLPMPECRSLLSDEVTMQHFAGKVRQLHESIEDQQEAEKVLTKQWPLRQEANSTVVQTYRNGPIESLHADDASRSAAALAQHGLLPPRDPRPPRLLGMEHRTRNRPCVLPKAWRGLVPFPRAFVVVGNDADFRQFLE